MENAVASAQPGSQEPPLGRLDDTVIHQQQLENQKLSEMNSAIDLIANKMAYQQAFEKHPAYVTDPKLRLVFLRTESHDATKAAQRFIDFLDEKQRRFGPFANARQLTLDDLNNASKSLLLRKGLFQVLPTRDSSGRAILLSCYHASQLEAELRENPKCLVGVQKLHSLRMRT